MEGMALSWSASGAAALKPAFLESVWTDGVDEPRAYGHDNDREMKRFVGGSYRFRPSSE